MNDALGQRGEVGEKKRRRENAKSRDAMPGFGKRYVKLLYLAVTINIFFLKICDFIISKFFKVSFWGYLFYS